MAFVNFPASMAQFLNHSQGLQSSRIFISRTALALCSKTVRG